MDWILAFFAKSCITFSISQMALYGCIMCILILVLNIQNQTLLLNPLWIRIEDIKSAFDEINHVINNILFLIYQCNAPIEIYKL